MNIRPLPFEGGVKYVLRDAAILSRTREGPDRDRNQDWRRRHPNRDAFEDRELEITSVADISVDAQIAAVEAALRGMKFLSATKT